MEPTFDEANEAERVSRLLANQASEDGSPEEVAAFLQRVSDRGRTAFPVFQAIAPETTPNLPSWRGDLIWALVGALFVLVLQGFAWAHDSQSLANLDWYERFEQWLAKPNLLLSLLFAASGVALHRLGRARWVRPILVAGAVFAVFGAGSWVYTEVEQDKTNAEAHALMHERRFVAYDPLEFDPTAGKMPTDEELERDLKQLHDEALFDGVITFGSDGSLQNIPRIAKDKANFKKVIMGIYIAPNDDEVRKQQTANAIAQRQWVDGYCLGHNPPPSITLADLAKWMAELRKATGKPVTCTFPLENYLDERGERLREIGDWYFPDVHGSWRFGATRAQLVEEFRTSLRDVAKLPKDKPVLCKMVSMPSAKGEGLSEQAQHDFFVSICRDTVPPFGVYLSFFAGYDIPWKAQHPEIWSPAEEHVGLFTAERRAKPAVSAIKEYIPR